MAEAGHDVLVLDRRRPDPLPPGASFLEGDAADTDRVLAALRDREVLVHLAHSTVPGSSMRSPDADVLENVAPTARLLGRIGETPVGSVLFVSSGGTVYGEPDRVPVDETFPTLPISSYGLTKLANENYVRMFCGAAGRVHRIVRLSNVYGEGQRTDRGQGVVAAMVDHAVHGTEFELWGTGEEVRDYVHIADVVGALRAVCEYRGRAAVFNASTGVGRSTVELMALVEKAVGAPLRVRRCPRRWFDVRRSVLSSALLQRETGWRPRVAVEEGIGRLVARARAAG
jgi:UDP-glucose 4-epimerase